MKQTTEETRPVILVGFFIAYIQNDLLYRRFYNDMKILVKKPDEVEPELIKTFKELVGEHSSIYMDGLYDRIAMAALLSFVIKDNKVLAIRAMKRPDRRYIGEIFAKARIPDLHSKFKHETGWSVTLPEHRCKGLSGILLQELLVTLNENVYSVTRKSNIPPQKILGKLGFEQHGKEFPGISEPLLLWLFGSIN